MSRRFSLFGFLLCCNTIFCIRCKTLLQMNRPASFQQVRNKTIIPEGIAIHPTTGMVYLSSLHQNKIVTIDRHGILRDLISEGQHGFKMGLGLKITKDGRILWACSSVNKPEEGKPALFAIDLINGKIITKVTHEAASFFNDLVIHSNGDIFITDTYQHTVFRYQPYTKQMEPWLKSEKLTLANGIALSSDENFLFVASGNQGVQRIQLATKEITPVIGTDYGIDGLVYTNNTLIGVIGWPQDQPKRHRIVRYYLSKEYDAASTDTLIIDKSFLTNPTTAALYKKSLFVISNTNIGLYFRNNRNITAIKNSLQNPIVLKLLL
jgi:hypothetical protein